MLLFYRYFAASPVLILDEVSAHLPQGLTRQEDLAAYQLELCKTLALKGKVR